MSTQDTETPSHCHRATATPLSLYLIGSVLWRLLVSAHEYPSRTVQVVGIIFDVFAVAALVGLRTHVPKPALFWARPRCRLRPVRDPLHQRCCVVDGAPHVQPAGAVSRHGALRCCASS